MTEVKANKSTKVPLMRDGLLYSDWKKELLVWERLNTKRGVDPSVLAGELFESLQGKARQTILSEVDVDNILHANGVKNIKAKLILADNFLTQLKYQRLENKVMLRGIRQMGLLSFLSHE